MRAVALHPDVLLVTSAVLQVNCVIVRGAAAQQAGAVGGSERAGETFVIDSPVLPDELDALVCARRAARFPAPSGLLATHGDWDHLLGRLAFSGVALGCAESTAERLEAAPGKAQRELRAFDQRLLIDRPRPLALGSVQSLPVPGRCAVGDRELELHPTGGHTPDGMAVLIAWASVLVAGDYLSPVELPTLNDGGDLDAYLATLDRLRPLAARAEHVGARPRTGARRRSGARRARARTHAICERSPSGDRRPSCRPVAAAQPSDGCIARTSRRSSACGLTGS